MTPHAWMTLLTLGAALFLLARDRVAPALALFGADVVLLVTGVIDADAALSGFGNPAPFTIAALYVLAAAVEKTGALQPLYRMALKPRGSLRQGLARITLPVAAASSVLNNTPVVAMSVPQVSAWAKGRSWAPSAFLMPLSFAAILGGTLTLIGSSTTLVVSGLLEEHGLAPLEMFEITPLAAPVVLIGLAYLLVATPRVLPSRPTAFSDLESHTRDYIVQLEVVPGGPLDGETVEGGGLRRLEAVFLVEIQRTSGEIIAPAAPDTPLAGGDVLVFAGRADQVLDVQGRVGLRSVEGKHADPFHAPGHTYFEAVVGSGSPLLGRTLQEANFRERYQAAVVGIHRAGSAVRVKLGSVSLRAGDTLLILSDQGFADRWRDRSDFLLIARRGGLPPSTGRQGWVVAGALGGAVGLSALGVAPILHLSLVAALAMVVLGVLTPGEARRSIDLDVILLIASAFGLAAAVESSGLASLVADGLVGLTRPLGQTGTVLGIVLMTMLCTEVITNNAAALLVFPTALAAAATAGLDPRVVALVVAVAASASFLTPIGYQTNTLVYGPGGYRFGDYARLGLPLTVIVIVVLSLLAPAMGG